jgi:hypothetical protein
LKSKSKVFLGIILILIAISLIVVLTAASAGGIPTNTNGSNSRFNIFAIGISILATAMASIILGIWLVIANLSLNKQNVALASSSGTGVLSPEKVQRLQQLMDMCEKGLITLQDYDQRKKKLLDN